VLLSDFIQRASDPGVGAILPCSGVRGSSCGAHIVGGGDQRGVIVMPAHLKPSALAPCCFLFFHFLCSVFLVPSGLSGLVFVTSRF
jgi:hypothetical protein